VNATAAVRSTDPARVRNVVADLGHRRRWLAPLAYAAGTVAVVFDGVLLLVRNWQLTLLQLAPAAWIYAATWNLRTHMLAGETPPVEYAGPIALGILVAAQVAYWCNATFAFTLVHDASTGIGPAFREARRHWRFVGGLALATGTAQALIWLLLPGWDLGWFWLALLVMFVIQIYLFVAIPAWLVGARKTGSRSQRLTQTLTTGVLSAVASIPGFLLNRIGLLLLGAGALWWLGIAVVAIAAVLHVTASSSVRVVKMSVKLRAGGES
jgi:hypothetical protein